MSKIITSLFAQFTEHDRIYSPTDGQQQSIFWMKKILLLNKFLESLS